ncbi:branched-chain amino acid transport system II carrier protein [Priestia flexa]|uniref:Branched-chain amino acid transport system carrier protein n=1 Tax=Priestia flexa TaxID=86664 RepID=A0A8I1ME08_9BACI|nr:branched-chain amino acid transport system II carrier protein [Priestia flexa]MBN8250705.1 branched-chain amino acid transport system II carrier protein [Priestia flexa]MBN8432473.1 branched-chain amino acid transport system II carrier protein [Priestia flexa]MCA0965542.1 branched-chain amino acid transport system II carrier protein [Priestia flexa]RIV10861.1 branched-chain amino acid transport system II carrier protein [Priestia flexa]UIR29592.1 branched-chain amino acid transport system I
MKKEALTRKETLAIGLMLFALFFGAGNMIFPPSLGQQAGVNTWSATVGFLITGVGLPLLGIIATSKTNGDFTKIANRVHPIFGIFFTIVLYLAIGPFFGIPRTDTVAFEIGVTPFLSDSALASNVPLMIYTIIFFGITLFLSLNPTKIVDRIGKVLTPLLLTVLAILVLKSLLTPMGEFQLPQPRYESASFVAGFVDGYLTMDAIAALVFGIVVISSIREKGIVNSQKLSAICIKAGFIAAIGLILVYVSLAYIGASSVESIGMQANGGAILTAVARELFGGFGTIILGLAITFACLTTSIGLISACSSFFNRIFPKLSYKGFVVVLTIFSAVIANVGLTQLISISVPILTFIYPIAISLIVLSLVASALRFGREVYVLAVVTSSFFSLFDGLNAANLKIASIDKLFTNYLPLYSDGMGWLIPTLIACIIGYMISKIRGSYIEDLESSSRKAS